VLAHLAVPIPSTLSYQDAAMLPLGLSTAARGLFQTNLLALQHPPATPQASGRTLLVWGGATSAGSNAIQLAVAAGYDVVTTCSPRTSPTSPSSARARPSTTAARPLSNDLTHVLERTTIAGPGYLAE